MQNYSSPQPLTFCLKNYFLCGERSLDLLHSRVPGEKNYSFESRYCILLGPSVAILKKTQVLFKEKTRFITYWLLNCPYFHYKEEHFTRDFNQEKKTEH